MREVMCEETQARIVLGGRIRDYQGKMPGIAEETRLSLRAQQPVFLLGRIRRLRARYRRDDWAC